MYPPDLPLLLLLVFASTVNAQDPFQTSVCNTTGNFTADDTYLTTLTTLLSSFSTPSSSSLAYGFFNDSAPVSGTSETLYVIGSCRGDLTAESCRLCLSGSALEIIGLCLHKKGAVLYKANCTVRYSNASIFGIATVEPFFVLYNVNNAKSPAMYNAALTPLLVDLQGKAATGGLQGKYATGNTSAVSTRSMQ